METISSHLRMSRNKVIDGQPSVQGIVLVLPCTNISPYLHIRCLKVLIWFKLSHYWASYLLAWPECEVATHKAASELTLLVLLNLWQQDHLLHVLAKNIGSFQHSHLSSAYPHVCGGPPLLCRCPSRNSIAVLCILYHTYSTSSRKYLLFSGGPMLWLRFAQKPYDACIQQIIFCAGNVVKVFNIDASPLYVTTKFGKFSIYILNHNLFVYSLLTSFLPC